MEQRPEGYNKIKMIALDMDGTTLCRDGSLSSYNQRAIEEALERGIHVVFATGRVLEALPDNVKAIPGIRYAITSNGANIWDLQAGESLYRNCIEPEQVEQLMDLVAGEDILVEVFVKGKAYIDARWKEAIKEYGLGEGYTRYALATRHFIPDMIGFVGENRDGVENVNFDFNDQMKKAAFLHKLQQISGITITSSLTHNWEVGGATTNKADGMRALCEYLGIDPKATLAVGDSMNDGAMLEYAGVSAAVENGTEELKALADHIVGSCEEDGAGVAIEQYALAESVSFGGPYGRRVRLNGQIL